MESTKYVEFKPVVQKKEHLIYEETPLSPEFQKTISEVLKYYKKPYKVENNTLSIPKSLYDDKELIWNYTTKARNESWVKEHL